MRLKALREQEQLDADAAQARHDKKTFQAEQERENQNEMRRLQVGMVVDRHRALKMRALCHDWFVEWGIVWKCSSANRGNVLSYVHPFGLSALCRSGWRTRKSFESRWLIGVLKPRSYGRRTSSPRNKWKRTRQSERPFELDPCTSFML